MKGVTSETPNLPVGDPVPGSSAPLAHASTPSQRATFSSQPPAGRVKMAYEWDWAEAENSFKQAIALDPKSAQFHAAYAFFLRMMGRLDEAHREQESADRLGSSIGEVTMGRVAQLVVEHQYDKAVEQSRQFLIHE